jgi:hypothetical protein
MGSLVAESKNTIGSSLSRNTLDRLDEIVKGIKLEE